MHGGTVNTCVSLAVLIAFLKRRWSCPPASKCAVLSLALGAQVPGAPPAGHRPSVTGRFSRAAPTPLNAGDTLHGTWQRCPPPLADSRSPCCLSSFFYSAHVHRGRRLLLHMHKLVTACRCLYSSVAECQSCKLKVLGSIPSGGFHWLCPNVCPDPRATCCVRQKCGTSLSCFFLLQAHR